MRGERGLEKVADTAFASLPSQSLITFVNKHLNKLNLEVTDLETQVSRASVEGPPGPWSLQLSAQVGCGNTQGHLVSLQGSSSPTKLAAYSLSSFL